MVVTMVDFSMSVSEEQLRQEREKARALRKTQWWRNRIGQGICHYCQQHFKAAELTLDHLVPLVRGGRSSKGNCVPACKNCNNLKKDLLPIEWVAYLERLQAEKE
jgi:5-methylcytosine-specific restriction enzyme A